MRYSFAALAAFFAFLAFSAPVQAAPAPAEGVKLREHALGKKDAPVVIEEYASLTCSHCGDFFENVLPELRKRYIDTGKLRLVFHEYPLDAIALKASALANCMPEEQFFPFVGILYKNLRTWVLSTKPETQIMQYARLGGLSEEKGTECMKDDALLDALVKERADAGEKYNINSTPTFVINGGKDIIVGAQGIDAFSAAIDKALAAKKN